jgi:hypothetical protein
MNSFLKKQEEEEILENLFENVSKRKVNVPGYVWVRFKKNPEVRYSTSNGKTRWSKISHAKSAIRLDIFDIIKRKVSDCHSQKFTRFKTTLCWREILDESEQVFLKFINELEFIQEV